MLGDEDGMISPGSLFAVIDGFGWSKSLCYKVRGVCENRLHPFSLQVIQLPATQSHAGAEFRFPQPLENVLHIIHQPMINRCEKFWKARVLEELLEKSLTGLFKTLSLNRG